MQYLIASAFIYTLIGSLIWMVSPPSFSDFALSRYVARNGRLPTAGFMGIAIVGVILKWPRVMMVLLRAAGLSR